MFRQVVRESLVDGPLTVAELAAAVTRGATFRHLRPAFDDGADTLVKPLMWQGDMSYGPPRDGRPTFQRLDDNPHWTGVWDLDQAGPHAIRCYFRAYGPATRDHVHHWLGNGLSAGRKRLDSWLAAMQGELEAIDVEGTTGYVLGEDLDDLLSARPTRTVRLLPGHDQWVMGPGTKDEHVVPPGRRTPVTGKANLVIAGGVVSGTWSAVGAEVRVTWFSERGQAPREALDREVDKLAGLLDRPLTPVVHAA